ncbi:lasso peptide biosynthesis B2 protein [Cognatishimia activa]|uniref:Microcin J25-processing protein McjB C-terminal domain-containing protein n=1 Tax=Cognatishimia activa TaxID=1715691 RepID=A0A0P1IVF2_9RHOB|nr:lasso peptide biosynthesis B2 protein [Cognatishimia activa]CUJ18994.1 hypothetical protein TA5113_02583 [Cognatishimia activa]CUK27617.1 hypothetical protein TA5114_03445 [Cognatishimia activa]
MAYLNAPKLSGTDTKKQRQVRRFTLLSVALYRIAYVRLMLSLRQVDRLKRQIKQIQIANKAQDTNADIADLREVAWSVSAASRLVPRATCLTQAMSGAWLMAQRGWISEVRLTIPTHAAKQFAPHAWLFHDQMILLGGTPEEFAQHSQFDAPTE